MPSLEGRVAKAASGALGTSLAASYARSFDVPVRMGRNVIALDQPRFPSVDTKAWCESISLPERARAINSRVSGMP